jgi:hypothetical protein
MILTIFYPLGAKRPWCTYQEFLHLGYLSENQGRQVAPSPKRDHIPWGFPAEIPPAKISTVLLIASFPFSAPYRKPLFHLGDRERFFFARGLNFQCVSGLP